MASPDVFLSSPPRGLRYRSQQHMATSSPDLPSLHEMLSQKPRKPPIRSGSKAAAIPANAPMKFTSPATLWRSAQANEAERMDSAGDHPIPEVIEDGDTSLSVMEVPPEKVPKARKPRRRKEETKAIDIPKPASDPDSPSKDQPWKKYKPNAKRGKSKSAVAEDDPTTIVHDAPEPVAKPTSKAEATSRHFSKEPKPAKPATKPVAKPVIKPATKPAAAPEKAVDENEPLQLEAAMVRRLDWTPPAKTNHIVLDCASPGSKEPASSAAENEQPGGFQQLLGTYKYEQSQQPEAIAISDEDSSFLKKRKLIELVVTKDVTAQSPMLPDVSPIKQKAPKKKPRTITELATRAYRPSTQPDEVHTTVTGGQAAVGSKSDSKGKGPAKPRKRAPRVSKKTAAPPKPILLSPNTALRQVAAQDFVFGTSSQLAREHSPLFLRDLQAAMRNSNQIENVDVTTPVNSDAIEPPEQRPKLWIAGARDVDGDLFDVELSNIAELSPQLPVLTDEANPFGYFQGDVGSGVTPVEYKPSNPRGDDSFVDLSDILARTPGVRPVEISDDSSNFPGSQVSVCSALGKAVNPPAPRQRKEPEPDVNQDTVAAQAEDGACSSDRAEQPPLPTYDLYTDAQLSKEVTSYGFKSIKKRTDMISLLHQCWQSKSRLGQVGVRAASTLSKAASQTASKSSGKPAATTAAKKPRGRPRKNSVSDAEVQEPPPSAQAPVSPKKPRGRPKKDAGSPSKAVKGTGKAKATTTTRKAATKGPTTPKRKTKSSKTKIEIPDSASESGSNVSRSASSSPEPTFSPPQIDLTLTAEEDTELSLTMTPSDQQSAVSGYITTAITTAPRTTDPANPSWHEKILLYDPIVLEDLAGWLNSGQLTRVGFDSEVSSGEVKKWCESKSVCCLWKVNLRGKERKRY